MSLRKKLKLGLKKILRSKVFGKGYEFVNHDSPHYFSNVFNPSPTHTFIDLDLEIDIQWENTRTYKYSKLYFTEYLDASFTEDQVICFRIKRNRFRHRIRIKLPDSATGMGKIKFRLDPFPYTNGQAYVYDFLLISDDDTNRKSSEGANLLALKQATRALVKNSEYEQLKLLPHYPESLSLELQPGCNLQCGHCATHGTPKAHSENNRLGAIEISRLQSLAKEVFPHLTLLHLVGRGEPLMVSDKLWSSLVFEAKKHQLLLTVVTNGYFIEQRISRDVITLIDTLTVSIDGLSPETFAMNRGGADFHKVIKGIQYYHEMRKNISLPRRPKLCISWTLKRNNIAELPDFIRFIAQFEPDRYYMRHLLVSHDKDEPESLIKVPDYANRYLAEAYRLIAEQGAETDCPPLFNTKGNSAKQATSTKNTAHNNTHNSNHSSSILKPCNSSDRRLHSANIIASSKDSPTSKKIKHDSNEQNSRDTICHYIHRTASIKAQGNMTTCGIYHAAKVGDFSEENSFWSLWNGDVLQAVRRDINTPNEWNQCRNCWYRESHYYSQREKRAKNDSHSLLNKTTFTEGAWDYRPTKKL